MNRNIDRGNSASFPWTHGRRSIARVAAAAAVLATALAARAASNAQDGPLAIVGATVRPSPSEAAIPNATVLVEGRRISWVGPADEARLPAGVRVIPAAGSVVVAGFWNNHVHLGERKWADAAHTPAPELEQMLTEMLTRFGFTSVWDTGSDLENTLALARRMESGEIAGPHIRTVGEILFPKGGSFPPDILRLLGFMVPKMREIGTPEEGVTNANALIDAGASAIKLYVSTWRPPIVTLSGETVHAVVEAAHARGKPVFAHPSDMAGLLASLAGPVDVLMHTAPTAGPWSAELIGKLIERRVALVPTLKLWEWENRHDRPSAAGPFRSGGIEQLRAFARAGGEVLFGTDVGYMDDYDPAREYALMASAGLDGRAILESLTTAPARRFGGKDECGRVAAGCAADLVLLGRDPLRDVTAFRDVRGVVRGGRPIYAAPDSPGVVP